jgi:hypothetical protein
MLPTPIDLTALFDPRAETELGESISFCLQRESSRLTTWLKRDMAD